MAIDIEEEENVVQNFLKDKDVSFKILLDKDGRVAGQYGIQSHPSKYLIDPDGKVVGIAEGYRKWDKDAMKSLIRQFIERKSKKTLSDASR